MLLSLDQHKLWSIEVLLFVWVYPLLIRYYNYFVYIVHMYTCVIPNLGYKYSMYAYIYITYFSFAIDISNSLKHCCQCYINKLMFYHLKTRHWISWMFVNLLSFITHVPTHLYNWSTPLCLAVEMGAFVNWMANLCLPGILKMLD